jgi:hypothetical protein
MKERNPSIFIKLTFIMFLTFLFALPAPAVKKFYTSNLQGGWQIWIEAGDFDRIQPPVQTGKDAKDLAKKAAPFLAGDIITTQAVAGFADYDFNSPHSGKAYMYARVMDLRPGGGQSWFLILNSDKNEPDGMIMDTGPAWAWKTGRNGPISPIDLKNGKNAVRAAPREAGVGNEPLLDVFVVSTKDFAPKDDDFKNAKLGLAVQSKGKLTTTWGSIKDEGRSLKIANSQ